MLFVYRFFFLSFIMLLTNSCTPKSTNLPKIEEKKIITSVESQNTALKTNSLEFSKTLREAIYFSNSLEREALRLILKDNSFQKLTLFSVLSYVVETNSGAKKSTPYGLDCGKFIVRREGRVLKIFKSCVKPLIEIADIRILEEERFYEIDFLIKEWAGVLGLAVALTGDDLRCQLSIKDKKLNELKCENWSYQTESDQTSSTVIKTKEFLFQREAQRQFIIKGGFFKELVENKKIDIIIPLEGKIKIFEKEIRVIDEFANRIKKESEIKNEKEEDLKKENLQETNKKSPEESVDENYKEVSKDDDKEGRNDKQKEAEQSGGQEEIQQNDPGADSRRSRGR